MDNIEELKPCPFCGREAEIYVNSGHATEGSDIGCVRCKECKAEIRYGWPTIRNYREQAIGLWNTRTP
jgi:Lar family restriction alleviation protein